ncbi:MAG: beta-ketoacyl-ACP synthase II [Pseudomonadaceae bacterium]|nr:beta-ketoacyl-ACP synthase II [Pseudomonadaceae bacterium]
MKSHRRVAVTGMGMLSPLGHDVESSWKALLAGETGVVRISRFDAAAYRCQVAAEVRGFEATEATTGMDAKELATCDRFTHYGLAAACQAMAQAGLAGLKEAPAALRERVGVLMSSGIGGLETLVEAQHKLDADGPRRVPPRAMEKMLINLMAGQISKLYGALGPNYGIVSACASSAHAIGTAMEKIRMGRADIVLAGGAEASITPVGVASFASMRALSSGFNETPEQASRPFSQTRDGFVMGEGAAALVLEAEDHARARGATILGYVDGYGETSDAFHNTTPSGEGANRAMRLAVADAGLDVADIAYINPHATSTPAGDEAEAREIGNVFGAEVPVGATKGATGHLLGAAGAVEAVFTLLALRDGMAPPNRNLTDPIEAAIAMVGPKAVPLREGAGSALSNSFGFGGTNASLVISRA